MKKSYKLEYLWLALILITLFNASLGEHFNSNMLVSIIIAFTTMYKGLMVIDHFMELKTNNKLLRVMMRTYFFIFPSLIIVILFI